MDKEDYKKMLDQNPNLELYYVHQDGTFKIEKIPAVGKLFDLSHVFLTQTDAILHRLMMMKLKRSMYENELENIGTAITEMKMAVKKIKHNEPVDMEEWDWAFGGRWGYQKV